MIKGQSFTIGIIFDAGYDKQRIQSLELNIGEKVVGKLSDNTISVEDDVYFCRLTSQQTSFLPSGNIPVTVHLQDSILGVRKPLVGTLEISTSKSKTTSEKSNELVDYYIELAIDGEQITTNATLQTMYQGAPGITPHIGENGNWWIGETDTGVSAEGHVIELEYSELLSRSENSSLIPGKQYLIKDYQTTHIISNTNIVNIGVEEPLIVKAKTNNKLYNEAYSIQYPNDIIYYSITNNDKIIPGCTKGYIYRRIDTSNNVSLPYDWRTVKFRRYRCNHAVWSSEITYNNGAVVRIPDDGIYVSIEDNNINEITNQNWVKILDLTQWEYWGHSINVNGVSFDVEDYKDVYTFCDTNNPDNSSGIINGTVNIHNWYVEGFNTPSAYDWNLQPLLNNVVIMLKADDSYYGNVRLLEFGSFDESDNGVLNNTFGRISLCEIRGNVSDNIFQEFFDVKKTSSHSSVSNNIGFTFVQTLIGSQSTIVGSKFYSISNSSFIDGGLSYSDFNNLSHCQILNGGISNCHVSTFQNNVVFGHLHNLINSCTHIKNTYTCTIVQTGNNQLTDNKLMYIDNAGIQHIVSTSE